MKYIGNTSEILEQTPNFLYPLQVICLCIKSVQSFNIPVHNKIKLFFCMELKCLLLCLALTLLCKAQTQLCGSQYCRQGALCIAGECFGPVLIDPFNMSTQYRNPKTSQCPSTPCPMGLKCVNKTCVSFTAVARGQTLNSKPLIRGILDRLSSPYATYYCDENIYYLCGNFDMVKPPNTLGYAVVMSNPERKVYLRQQKLSEVAVTKYLIIWNYHVIFIAKSGKTAKVYDFDSRLPWGASFEQAWSQAMMNIGNETATQFRVIPYKKYLENFASLRLGNIVTKPNGARSYKHPPSRVNLIVNKYGEKDTLPRFINMTYNNPQYGSVLTASQFYTYFSS